MCATTWTRCWRTFGLILFLNELTRIIWGPAGLSIALLPPLNRPIELAFGIHYSVYRIVIIAVGLTVALGLYVLVTRTRAGMLIRAGGVEPDDGRRPGRQHPALVHRSCSASARRWPGSPA